MGLTIIEKIYLWCLKMSSKVSERGEPSAGYWHDKVRTNALEIVSLYGEGKILEVGCGEGLFLRKLLDANPRCHAYGVDNWPEALSKAQQRLSGKPVSLSKGNIMHLPFPEGYFDAVVCINVFVNMKDKEEARLAIEEMSRVCKPGGKMIVEFRNSLNIFVVLKFKLAVYYDAAVRTKTIFLSAFREQDIAAFLKEAHFKVKKTHYIGFFSKRSAPIVILVAEKEKR